MTRGRGRGASCGSNAENRVSLGVLVLIWRKNRKCGVCARHGRLTRIWRPYLVRKIFLGTRWRRRRRSMTRSSEVAYLEGRCVRVFRRLEGAKITGSSRFYVDRVLATLVLLSGFTTVDMSTGHLTLHVDVGSLRVKEVRSGPCVTPFTCRLKVSKYYPDKIRVLALAASH